MGEVMADKPTGRTLAADGVRAAYADKAIHLIGVGGSGMRALAQLLAGRGASVSGSDSERSEALADLESLGVSVVVGQRAENLPDRLDLVVHSAAIHPENPELLAARQRGCEVIKYSRMLGRLMSDRCGIAIAGTHGKSTTTAMVAHTLRAAGASPSFIVGATSRQLGGPSGVGTGPHFVAEACEYDRSFLNLCPTLAAILNIDEDHLDCYENLGAIIEAFRAFAIKIPPEGVLVANGDDPHVGPALREPAPACEVQTFGLGSGRMWNAGRLSDEDGLCRFDVQFTGRRLCRVQLRLPGRHQVYNALAAAALCHHAGLGPEDIAAGLSSFEGVDRRTTCMFEGGVTVVDDYAHHPTEIKATLEAINDRYRP
ncbi:hypothetical protein LCGC14_2623000, partial [marine sediment metagenome]